MKSSHASLLVILLTGAACTDAPTSPRAGAALKPVDARPVSIPAVSLTVSIDQQDAGGAQQAIQPDGQGTYVDGLQGVEAKLDAYGTFVFNTYTGKKNATRWVVYDFNNPVDPANPYRPSPSNLKNYHFSTGASAHAQFIPIQSLGINGNPSSECIYMGNSFANATTSWRVSYHKGLEDLSNSATAYAVVTRTSVTPATWTITPSGDCSPQSNVAALRSGDGSVLLGYYNLPFSFTLRAK